MRPASFSLSVVLSLADGASAKPAGSPRATREARPRRTVGCDLSVTGIGTKGVSAGLATPTGGHAQVPARLRRQLRGSRRTPPPAPHCHVLSSGIHREERGARLSTHVTARHGKVTPCKDDPQPWAPLARTRFKAERDVLNRTQTAPSVKGKNGPTGPRGSQGLVLRRDRCRRVGPRGGRFCNVSPRAGERPRTPSPLKRGEADGLKIGQTPEPALRGRRVRVSVRETSPRCHESAE